jgi:hypothetical protein
MAIVTKIYLMEQVRSLLNGGDPSIAAKYEPRIILSHLQSAINKRLKAEYFGVTAPGGDTIPDGLILASYDNVEVEAYKDRSRAQLPAMPVKLPRNMGVYHVSLTNDLDNPMIPLGSGQFAYVAAQNLINELLGQVGYEIADGWVIFAEDLTARTVPVTAVFMRLVVADFDHYADYDMLPMSADMAADVVTEVAQMLLQTPEPDKRVDSTTNQPPRG